jgi:hypothetical protein
MDHLGADVVRELGRVGGSTSGTMPKIVDAWREAVGHTIARNAWPARISRDRTLHVATDSSAWAFELQQLEVEVLARLRAAVGAEAPTRLRFAVGTLPEAAAAEAGAERRPAREPTAEERRSGATLAAAIEAAELRETVARAAALSLAAAAADRSF